VLPNSHEVGLIGKRSGHLVGENKILLLDHFRSELAKVLPLFLESSAALFSSGVNAKVNVTILVCVSERVQTTVLLTLIILVQKVVTAIAPPGGKSVKLRYLVVEETGAKAAAPLLETEPLEHVGLLTLTRELGWGPLSLHIVHGVVPSLTGVVVNFPAVLFLGGGPVRNLEALEDGTGLSVETDVTHTLEEGFGVEVLSVDVVHDVGLLVEFVIVDILDAHAYNNN
jgi:hypothetical protein